MPTRRSPRFLDGALLALAITVANDAARAMTCGRNADAMSSPPPLGVRAPRNVQPRITLHATWRVQSFCPPWGSDRRCLTGRFDLVLRTAGSGAPAPAFVLRESSSGDIATVVIVPSAPLPANERFEVLYVEQDAKEPPRVVATFATGDRIDDKPPSWSGVTAHSRVGEWPTSGPPRPPRSKPGVVTISDDLCSGPGITFTGEAAATDDDTRGADLRYAIWMGDPAAAIDYTAPPLAYEHASLEPKLVLRFGGSIAPNDFSFPAGKRRMKIGIRAIDLAGNASAPSEQLVDAP